MDAEERVMKQQDIEGYVFGDSVWKVVREQLVKQDEISFSAGVAEGWSKAQDYYLKNGGSDGS